ncbi:hypothetical protein HGRIS_011270 [Hohenbuehelia grisea]|uniref:Uncharacterized protein n=1 Tax=Hohenbuehelia grisea TaxID=104357 RepID=A0ABR3JVH2_9AGAR
MRHAWRARDSGMHETHIRHPPPPRFGFVFTSFATFWQYADSGPNPGDQDIFNGDAAGLKRIPVGIREMPVASFFSSSHASNSIFIVQLAQLPPARSDQAPFYKYTRSQLVRQCHDCCTTKYRLISARSGTQAAQTKTGSNGRSGNSRRCGQLEELFLGKHAVWPAEVRAMLPPNAAPQKLNNSQVEWSSLADDLVE